VRISRRGSILGTLQRKGTQSCCQTPNLRCVSVSDDAALERRSRTRETHIGRATDLRRGHARVGTSTSDARVRAFVCVVASVLEARDDYTAARCLLLALCHLQVRCVKMTCMCGPPHACCKHASHPSAPCVQACSTSLHLLQTTPTNLPHAHKPNPSLAKPIRPRIHGCAIPVPAPSFPSHTPLPSHPTHISCRGTHTLQDVITDVNIVPVLPYPDRSLGGLRVFGGAWTHLCTRMMEVLSLRKPKGNNS
jgi:hypothetical protein